jgi:hypothetical protein
MPIIGRLPFENDSIASVSNDKRLGRGGVFYCDPRPRHETEGVMNACLGAAVFGLVPVPVMPTSYTDMSHYGLISAVAAGRRRPFPSSSSIGRGTLSNFCKALFIGDNDLRAVDPDQIGIPQVTELPADIGTREAQILP